MLRLLSLGLILGSALALPAVAEEIGECRFSRETLTFAGTPLEQATCLLRKIELKGVRVAQPLPPVIVRLMTDGGVPSAAHKAAAIAAFPEPYRSYAIEHANDPVSQTEEGLPLLYFVIHDTSTPFYGNDRFPRQLDRDLKVNDFTPYMDGSIAEAPVAHIFLNRVGQIWAGHEFQEGWRATKLESRVVGPRARGRFIHIETVQPRRFLPGATSRGQTYGPKPGFTREQYRMLAALYVYASARAGRWLIPAQHNTVDSTIPQAHDDPQNFDLKAFGKELERLVKAG
ncbi:MAG: N-acetylmuramoyl-L-alanine amidase [Sphingomonadales bacterium]|nr:N-acetylmuramoyl-L-alanine amidase [Sphingomonadales bacterium]